ncbi:MAG TPA: hypothetical protein VFN26_08300 [Candidatus Acidoferrum sp.]|nr:hypothetical protein [Candidatus Acidoferrum sp.]
MNTTAAKSKEQTCQAVSHLDEPCDEPGQRHCDRCGLWFCRAHFPDPEWHPCAPDQGTG